MTNINLKGYTKGEGYNLLNISVSYDHENDEIVVIYPMYGVLLYRLEVSLERKHFEKAPISLNTNEWKQYLLADENAVEFMHNNIIEYIVRRNILLENNLYDKCKREVKKEYNRIMENN